MLHATLLSLVFKSKVGSCNLKVNIQIRNVLMDELGNASH